MNKFVTYLTDTKVTIRSGENRDGDAFTGVIISAFATVLIFYPHHHHHREQNYRIIDLNRLPFTFCSNPSFISKFHICAHLYTDTM